MANVKSAESHAWLQFWARRAIPILQESRNQLMGMIRRAEMIRPSEVADVVARDPLLTAQVLRMINQRERGSLSSDIVAIESAIMLIGVMTCLASVILLGIDGRFVNADTYPEVSLTLYHVQFNIQNVFHFNET